ncbi:MAG: addiction module protein [Proteobacteria bacterium]|nr:addiction module protein [Pseudomonadota bacterium]MBS0609086.1 addiction module protein [Pseudomonadota bacterium]
MNNLTPDFRALSIAERIQLVEDIWDSIAAEGPDSVDLTDPQRQELRRRIAAHDADPGSAVPWDTVRAELFQQAH